MKYLFSFLLLTISASLFCQDYSNNHSGTGDIVNGNKNVYIIGDTSSHSSIGGMGNSNTGGSECATKNVGDFCIYNDNKSAKMRIQFYNGTAAFISQIDRRLEIEPGRSECMLDLPAGVYHYSYDIYDGPFHNGTGDFRVKACESNQTKHFQ